LAIGPKDTRDLFVDETGLISAEVVTHSRRGCGVPIRAAAFCFPMIRKVVMFGFAESTVTVLLSRILSRLGSAIRSGMTS